MPPVQASDSSQYFFVDNYDVIVLTCTILSLLFILLFTYVIFLACQSIARRCRTYGNAFHRSTTSPVLRSPKARNVRKETLFSPTVSALVVQSALVASHPIRLGVVPDNLLPSSATRCSEDILSRGLEPSSWGGANIKQFANAAATPNRDGPRLSNVPPTTLRGLRMQRFFGLFAGLRQQASSPSSKQHAESHRHAPGVIESANATGEPHPDVLEPDTVDIAEIFLSADDAQFKTITHPMPLIILSLPSSENLFEELSYPVPLDEDLLSPDGTFRSSGRPAWVAAQINDISDATRLALASRLRHREKQAISFSSPDVLTSPGVVRWPRWL